MADARIDFEAVARGLAYSLAIKLRTTPEVERWLTMLDEMWADDDMVACGEHQLLSEAWEQLRADRWKRGVCVDCDYAPGRHDPRCPHYHDATEAAERR